MIIKAALLIFRGDGDNKEMLMLRSKGKPYFVFPGGKQEPGETIEQALHRELQEELQVVVKNPQEIGTITGTTPDGRVLEEHLFSGQVVGVPTAANEIEELAWMTRSAALARPQAELTPIALGKIFPFLRQQGIW